jgi:hypothetical protein
MKKTRSKKSRDTVPLNSQNVPDFFVTDANHQVRPATTLKIEQMQEDTPPESIQ